MVCERDGFEYAWMSSKKFLDPSLASFKFLSKLSITFEHNYLCFFSYITLSNFHIFHQHLFDPFYKFGLHFRKFWFSSLWFGKIFFFEDAFDNFPLWICLFHLTKFRSYFIFGLWLAFALLWNHGRLIFIIWLLVLMKYENGSLWTFV